MQPEHMIILIFICMYMQLRNIENKKVNIQLNYEKQIPGKLEETIQQELQKKSQIHTKFIQN